MPKPDKAETKAKQKETTTAKQQKLAKNRSLIAVRQSHGWYRGETKRPKTNLSTDPSPLGALR
jgi:hypothetical protein